MADVPANPNDHQLQMATIANPAPIAGADAGDAAEALAALQGATSAPQHHMGPVSMGISSALATAPGAPPGQSPLTPGVRIPGMGRGTSLYRGVSKAGDKKKWRAMIQYNHEQHHVGYYATAEDAARAYDRKALLFMGPSAITNFPASDYAREDLTVDGTAEEQMRKRRRTSSFRGVTKAGGKWKATIRSNNVKKELGIFEDEVEAARAYDAAAVHLWGASAVTNFNVQDIMAAPAAQPADASAAAPDASPQIPVVPLSGGASESVQSGEAATAAQPPLAAAGPRLSAAHGLPAPSRFHGVRPAGNGKWHAQVVVDVGRFDSEVDAARAYDRAAVWCLGLTAQTNFPVSSLIQPGPVGKEQAPVHASSGHGGVPSHSDDDEAEDAQEVVAPEGAAAAQAPADVPPATSAPSLNQESLGYGGAQFMDMLQLPRQASSGQEPGTSGQAAVDSTGQAGAAGIRPGKASRFVGLSKKFNRWKALIKVCGRRKELGSFQEEEEAARCYDRHSVLAWGARARTNFNPLELVGGLPGEAQTVLDAAAAGQSERSNSGRGRGGGGAISQAVASALVEHPAASDSSTREGQLAHAAIASAMAVHSYKKSAHRGVSANWSRWRAQIYVNGRRHELGSFTSEAEAARAYDLAAIRLYGLEKAKTNFPVADYAEYSGAAPAGNAPNSGNANGPQPCDSAANPGTANLGVPPAADGQALPADLQALIAAQLQAAAQAAAQQQPEGAPQGAVLQLPCMLGHMLAHAAHPATPQGSQAPALQNPTAPHGGPNQARPPS